MRSIIEEIMRDIMFDVPSKPNIKKCIITKETVLGMVGPKLEIGENPEQQEEKKKREIPNKKETA